MVFKAIPTTYNGMTFRSRFESEAAMLLDKLGLQWEYEPKSFLLPGGHYMPDFFIPTLKTWVEVRGYDGKDWQIDQFKEHIKDSDQSYVVLKSGGVTRVANSSGSVVFNKRVVGATVLVYSENGHLAIRDSMGKTQSIMEWPGFSEMPKLDLANILLEERSSSNPTLLDTDFYLRAMSHLNELSLNAKNESDPVEKQILSDIAKSERFSLVKIVDIRIKKILRRALRISAAKEDVLLDGLSAEESKFLLSTLGSLGEVRDGIYSNAFQSDEPYTAFKCP